MELDTSKYPNVPYVCGKNQIEATYGLEGTGKDHFVMWSGGCDSTMLLYELLRHYGPEHVIAISYVYPWLPAQKVQNEKDHRTAFIAAMKLRGLAGFRNMELKITQENVIGSTVWVNQGAGLPQALAWMLSVPLYATEGSYIYDGGIRNDDLTLRLEKYHEMFRGLAGVMRRDITLREPYLYLTKANIIEKLIQADLYNLTWFCETPNDGMIRHCGRCTPCKTHHNALIELSETTEDPHVKAVVERALIEFTRTSSTDTCMTTRLQCEVDSRDERMAGH